MNSASCQVTRGRWYLADKPQLANQESLFLLELNHSNKAEHPSILWWPLTQDSSDTQRSPFKLSEWEFWHLDLYVIPRENYLKGSIMAIIFIANLLLVIYFQQ